MVALREKGYIFTERKSKRTFTCAICKQVIEPDSIYYEVIKGGGGLGWIKHPDRIHLEEREQYLIKYQ